MSWRLSQSHDMVLQTLSPPPQLAKRETSSGLPLIQHNEESHFSFSKYCFTSNWSVAHKRLSARQPHNPHLNIVKHSRHSKATMKQLPAMTLSPSNELITRLIFFSTKSEIICLICVLYLRRWWTRIYFGTLCRIYMEHFGVRDRNNCEWLFPSVLDLRETQWGDMGDAVGMGVWDGACALGNANGCRVMLLCMRPNTGRVIWTCWEPLSWP